MSTAGFSPSASATAASNPSAPRFCRRAVEITRPTFGGTSVTCCFSESRPYAFVRGSSPVHASCAVSSATSPSATWRPPCACLSFTRAIRLPQTTVDALGAPIPKPRMHSRFAKNRRPTSCPLNPRPSDSCALSSVTSPERLSSPGVYLFRIDYSRISPETDVCGWRGCLCWTPATCTVPTSGLCCGRRVASGEQRRRQYDWNAAGINPDDHKFGVSSQHLPDGASWLDVFGPIGT